jgi:hypothetical protein
MLFKDADTFHSSINHISKAMLEKNWEIYSFWIFFLVFVISNISTEIEYECGCCDEWMDSKLLKLLEKKN